MMKHLFIPYELAVIAKEKGFKDDCIAYFNSDNEIVIMSTIVENNSSNLVSAPIYHQLLDWLKEKHSIVIYTKYFNNSMGEWWDWRIAYTGKYGTETKYYDALNSAINQAFIQLTPTN